MSSDRQTSTPCPDAASHDGWFRAKVQAALEDSRADTPDEQAEAHFAERRLRARCSVGERHL
ncbi:hypothetical protein [Ciceribacter selenitireducens]|uniref:antitoxin PaaA2 family protein n=1 Tax=Ciceribacter selenitireducens TaxID=448181 RepID=UPI002E25D37B